MNVGLNDVGQFRTGKASGWGEWRMANGEWGVGSGEWWEAASSERLLGTPYDFVAPSVPWPSKIPAAGAWLGTPYDFVAPSVWCS
jgi:hypothetical protein